MWVVEAHFDDGAHRSKLLKPNKSYKIGRKAPAELIIASKTVSQATASIVVGAFNPGEGVKDFETRPSITLVNSHDRKPIGVLTGEATEDGPPEQQVVEAGSSFVLQEGDQIQVTALLSIAVRWWPSEFVAGSKIDKDLVESRLPACAEAGIHLYRNVKAWESGGTHLIVPHFKLTPQAVTALASAAHVVTLAYLDELIRRAGLAATEAASLEVSFDPPDPGDYVPPSGTAEIPDDQLTNLVRSDPARKTMFTGATALFVYDGDEVDQRCHQAASLFQLCGGQTDMLGLNAANFSSQSDAQRTLRAFKTAALSHYHACGEGSRNAPDEGLVVLAHDDELLHADDRYNNIRLATRAMGIRMADEGSRAVAAAIIYNDPRGKLNATAPEPGATQGPSTQMTTDAPMPEDEAQPDSMPRPTAATAGSSMSPSERIEQDFQSAAPSQIPPPTAEPQPQQVIDADGASAPAATQTPTPMASEAASTATRRPAKRKAPAAKSTAFDQLFGSTAADGGESSLSDRDNIRTPIDITDNDGPAPVDEDPQPSRVSNHHLSAAQLKRRAANTQRQSRLSDLFSAGTTGSVSSGNGVPGSQSVLGGADRVSKRYRALLEQEEGEASQAAADGDSNAEAVPPSQQQTQRILQSAEHASPPRKRVARGDDRDAVRDKQAQQQRTGALDASVQRAEPASDRRDQSSFPNDKDKTSTAAYEQPAPRIIRAEAGPRGNAPGQAPDTEPQLLQALATGRRKTKKGTQLDDFDKEFNNLRLTKPSLNQKHASRVEAEGQGPIEEDEDFQAWKAAAIEDFPAPVGNFVQVDYVSLIRKEGAAKSRASSNGTQTYPEWRDRPNFKKFKAKSRPTRKPITMDLTEPQDFGMGSEYLDKPAIHIHLGGEEDEQGGVEGGDDDIQMSSGLRASGRAANAVRKVSGGSGNILKALADSDDEEDAAAEALSRRPRRGAAASQRDGRARVRLDSVDEDEMSNEDDGGDQSIDLRLSRNVEDEDLSVPSVGSRSTRNAKPPERGTKRGRGTVVDSEDEDDDRADTPSTMSRGNTSTDASQVPSSRGTGRARGAGAGESSSRASGSTATSRKRPASMLTDDDDDDDDDQGGRSTARQANDAQDVRLRGRTDCDDDDDDDDDEGVFKGFKGTQSSRRGGASASSRSSARTASTRAAGTGSQSTRSGAKRSRSGI